MARLIGSHDFRGECSFNRPLSRDRGVIAECCKQWHGGAKCIFVRSDGTFCGFPKFEHEYDYTGAERGWDSQSSYGMVVEIRQQISGLFPFRNQSRTAREKIELLLVVLHAGDMNERGSLANVISRKWSQAYNASH